MAIWYAQASGNLSALTYTAESGGGGATTSWAAMPETDSVESNFSTITIDVVGWTRLGLSSNGFGVFNYSLTGDNVITCNIAALAASCLACSQASGTLTIVGDIAGGTAGNAIGIKNNSSGSIVIIGDVMGGSDNNCKGIENTTGMLSVTGNVSGGTGGNAYGVVNGSSENIIITGSLEGGTLMSVYGAINLNDGKITVIGQLIFGDSKETPLDGDNCYLELDSVSYFKAPGDGPYTLEDTAPQGLFPNKGLYP